MLKLKNKDHVVFKRTELETSEPLVTLPPLPAQPESESSSESTQMNDNYIQGSPVITSEQQPDIPDDNSQEIEFLEIVRNEPVASQIVDEQVYDVHEEVDVDHGNANDDEIPTDEPQEPIVRELRPRQQHARTKHPLTGSWFDVAIIRTRSIHPAI